MAAPRIAVIGGGISGLTIAFRLLQKGAEPTLFESEPRTGGVVGSKKENGFLLESAVNGFLSGTGRGGHELCEELGVPLAQAGEGAKRRWVFRGGKLRELPTGLGSFLSGDFLSLFGKGRLLLEPFARAAKEQDESVADFFRRRLGKHVISTLVDPFVTGVFAGDIEKLSIAAAFPRLVELDRRGGFLRGRKKKEKGTGKRRLAAPADGVEALIKALTATLENRISCGARVENLSVMADQKVAIAIESREPETFDSAVVAVPAYEASKLFKDSPKIQEHLNAIPYVPIAIAYLGFKKKDVAHSTDGFGFLVAPGEPKRILGCVFESAIFQGRAESDTVWFRCIFGGARDPSVASLSEEELIALATKELADVLGAKNPIFTRTKFWPRAIAQYHLGHLGLIAEVEKLAHAQKAILAGAAFHGVAFNDCIAGADKAATDALALAAS